MKLLTLAVYLPITTALLVVVYLMSGGLGLGLVFFGILFKVVTDQNTKH